MRRRDLLRSGVTVVAGLATYVLGSRAAAANVSPARYELRPGRSTIFVSTGASAPLRNVSFIVGGPPSVKTERITGATGRPQITFNPAARPFEVTVHFAQNPLTASDSSDFTFVVVNETGRDTDVEIVIRYD